MKIPLLLRTIEAKTFIRFSRHSEPTVYPAYAPDWSLIQNQPVPVCGKTFPVRKFQNRCNDNMRRKRTHMSRSSHQRWCRSRQEPDNRLNSRILTSGTKNHPHHSNFENANSRMPCSNDVPDGYPRKTGLRQKIRQNSCRFRCRYAHRNL